MTTKFRIFLLSFILSLPFWWGMNALGEGLEDFLYWQELAKTPQIFTAQANQLIFEKERPVQRVRGEDLKIRTKAAISVEIDSKGNERILFEKNSQMPLPIASLTKLMTALVVFDLDETYDLSQVIRISEQAASQEGESKYGKLLAGEYFSVETLLNVMLIESNNDAAYAISELISQEGFVGLMNLYARDLGLESTRFANSTGLDPDNLWQPKNISTTQDLVKLTKHILKKHHQIFEITNSYYYDVLRPNGTFHHLIPENTNKLLIEVPEIVGGKTGWSLAADGCLLLILEKPRGNGYFVNVVLGAKDRFAEMREIIEQVNKIPIAK